MPDTNFFTKLGLAVVPDFFDADLCDALREEARQASKRPGFVVMREDDGSPDVERVDEDMKQNRLASISAPTHSFVVDRIQSMRPELEEHFHTPLSEECIPPRFYVYRPGDFYRPHKDFFDDSPEKTGGNQYRISIVIFLNSQDQNAPENDSYAGGSLVFYGLIDNPATKNFGVPLSGKTGLMVAFPSMTLHEVQPVTKGNRYIIVTHM